MTTFEALAAFVAAAAILTITPGVDTAMVLRTAAAKGARPAWMAALGIASGCLLWGLAVSAGLGALLAASPAAFAVLKWSGALYLFYLGLRLILKPRTSLQGDGTTIVVAGRDAFRQGLLTNILNPKVGVFYVTFLPQFVPDGAKAAAFIFLLAAIHAALTLIWFAVMIAATAPVGRALARPAVLRALDRLTGIVFVGFGVRLALSRAP